LIRHLVLPDDLAVSGAVLRFVAEEISKDTYINIMDQYYPAHQAFRYEELSRRITAGEYKKVLSLARDYGLTNIL
jgi:putative pyruvate formate lyase activating enzyme